MPADGFVSPLPVHRRVSSWVTSAERAVHSSCTQALRPLEITFAQYVAMVTLAQGPDVSSADLARACDVTPQTMAVTVKHLESKGLVSRGDGPPRGAPRPVMLTQRGVSVLHDADGRVREVERTIAAALRTGERETLERGLAAVVRALETPNTP